MSFSARIIASLALVAALSVGASAKDLRIPIPRRSKPTPVQKYNQEGVKQLKKGHVQDAKKSFYKAYLVDPNDPFTLNNLGYIAELEGEVDRATRYYDLAAANSSDAIVDKSVSKKVVGKPVSQVAGRVDVKGPLQVNRLNVQAIGLLEHDRVFEAEAVLNKALTVEPTNPFTLNNLGYTKEKEGELEQAVQFYEKAAAQQSDERIIVAVEKNKGWRGKKISDIADKNADKVRRMIEKDQSPEAQVARLNLRGVTALNRNDRNGARNFFFQAYKLDPKNAFALNNMGYIAELEGDKESANAYYSAAQNADKAKARVGLASRRDAEGRPIAAVADSNETVVAQGLETELAQKRRERAGKPVQMKTRDNEIATPPTPQKDESEEDQNQPQQNAPAAVPPPTTQPPVDQQPPTQNPPSHNPR
jgi:Flp pilus assembly protein TadD